MKDNLKDTPKAGLTATLVSSDGATVTMEPTDKTFGTSHFFQKYKNQILFRELCQGLKGVIIPEVLELTPNRAVVEKAEGINLTTDTVMSVGTNEEFLQITTLKKLEMAWNYLHAVNRANKDGRSIIDHKPDSVFITAEGVVTITDCGDMETVTSGTPYQHETMGENDPLTENIVAFFTRNNPEFAGILIPEGFLRIIINDNAIKTRKTPDGILKDLAKYLDGNTIIDPQPPITIGTQKVDLYKPNMSQLDYDVAVAEAWRNFELNRIDKK